MTKYRADYWSLDEYAAKAEEHAKRPGFTPYDAGQFTGYASFSDALALARTGWSSELQTALDIAESAVELCEREHVEQFTFTPSYDVTGADVDVARFLSGEPECMVEYPATITSKAGRVITLCASMSYSGSINSDVIKRRGQTIVALAMVLTTLGHACEIWLDFSSKKYTDSGEHNCTIRVLIKGANDVIDPAKIMFAFAHPAMLRQLGFATMQGVSKGAMKATNSKPAKPPEDLPEGTIYLPQVLSEVNIPDAHIGLENYLRELGLITS